MNEYTMELVNELRDAEKALTALRAKVDYLMALVTREEINTADFNRRNHFSAEASIKCADINLIFGWCNAELLKEVEDEG